MSGGGGCRRTGYGADCGGRGVSCCAQNGVGGVVRMGDGAVTFKGGTISNTTAVRARLLCSHVSRVSRRMLQILELRAACCARHCVPRGGHGTQRRRHVVRKPMRGCDTCDACCALRHGRYMACTVRCRHAAVDGLRWMLHARWRALTIDSSYLLREAFID
jgi:hypothetical protein